MTPPTESLAIIILSGGTGRTGEEIINTALAQFDRPAVELIRRPNVRSPDAAREVIDEARRKGAVVLHTLVAPETREAATAEAERNRCFLQKRRGSRRGSRADDRAVNIRRSW